MSMFCYQCQEAAKGTGCTVAGMCGKPADLAGILDVLIYVAKGVSIVGSKARELGVENQDANEFVIEALFISITNANYDKVAIEAKINKGFELRSELITQFEKAGGKLNDLVHDSTKWVAKNTADITSKAASVGVLATENKDVRSLRELLIYGIKGLAAYAHHAIMLGYNDNSIHAFVQRGLTSTTIDTLSADELTALVIECGKYAVDTMALLDKANTTTYGNPEITEVNLGVRDKPAILISGHDLKDMDELLKQTEGTGVDVYTHSEMLPAHYYPAFKKYEHFVGNYGNAWWKQKSEFESFNGPILMTTNCIVPPKKSYIDRIYTTGSAGFGGVKHIAMRNEGGHKDFSAIIEHAKKCASPTEIETGKIVGGFAHNQVLALSDKIVAAVKSGAIKKFVVMAGCDGRVKEREYYTEFADKLPKDTIILTAGCAKYRYNKLELGDIDGIPRVLDAGQCNDSYSLAVIALKLKEVFELTDINDLPIAYNIAWYEQKAVTVLLALLYLGVKNISLGPTLPAFLSPNVANILVSTFGIRGITTVEEDMKLLIG